MAATDKTVEMDRLVTQQDDEVEGRIGLLLGAASKNDCPRLLRLLRSGAGMIDANSADYDKRTALHLAASEGHMEATKLLIEEKADPNRKDRFGLSALDEAIGSHHTQVANFLKANGATLGSIGRHEGDLIQASNDNDIKKVRNLIDNGVNVNCADYDRRTPLHLATASGNLEVVDALLKAGANPKAADRWGGTPLDEVSRHAVRVGVNRMSELFGGFIEKPVHQYLTSFSIFFSIFEVIMIILMCTCATYGETATAVEDEAVQAALSGSSLGVQQLNRYAFFQDVNVMIFVGFGYLMTFLKKNAYQSLGLTFLLGAFCVQWHILADGFFEQAFAGHFHKINVTTDSIIFGDFAAGAVLITYGVMLGKVSPFQMLFMAIWEVMFFAVNEHIGKAMGIADIGGSMVIHMFGAFFGLAASLTMKNKNATDNDSNAAVYHSDLFAMIGTVFLWMFWPSFNAAMGSGDQQHRAVLNTCLSLAGSCVAAYLASHIFRAEKRFNMVDIQNATLAGGVAMGTAADMAMGPGFAILIGAVGGVVSVFGYVFVQPFLEEKLGLHDTCGVNNLHGLPSIVGAVAGACITAAVGMDSYGPEFGNTFGAVAEGTRTMSYQAAMQAAFMFITLCMSIGGGIFTAFLASASFFEPIEKKDLFHDEAYWEVPELENPYYFDHRGEIARGNSHETTGKVGVDSRVDQLEQRINLFDEKIKHQGDSAGGSSKLESVFEKILSKLDHQHKA